MQDEVLNFAWKFLERHVEVKAVRHRRQLHRPLQIGGRRAWPEAALEKRLRPIHYYLRRIEIILRAETVALGASAVWRIEAEGARLELRDGNAAIGARQFFGIDALIAADD